MPAGDLGHHRGGVGIADGVAALGAAAERTAPPHTGSAAAVRRPGRAAADAGAAATTVGVGGAGAATGAALLERGDLIAGHRAPQVAHRPAGGEHLGLVLAGPAQHELALGQPADRVTDRLDVDATGGRAHPVEQALLVAVGLQPTDHPGPGVGDRLVVDVDRVLGGQHDAQPERAGLLHHRHDRLLGRRVGRRGQVAHHLVHVQQRPQIGGAALASHPRDDLGQQHRGDELALLVGQVSRGEDGAAGRAVGGVEQRLHVERLARRPRSERRGGEETVELHRQRGAVLGGEELLQLEHAELADRRLLHLADQRRQVERLAL